LGYFLHSPSLEAKQQNLGENARSPAEFLRYFPVLSSPLSRRGGPHDYWPISTAAALAEFAIVARSPRFSARLNQPVNL
jgi:hypothetical protein